jgi:hypothetical protein
MEKVDRYEKNMAAADTPCCISAAGSGLCLKRSGAETALKQKLDKTNAGGLI